jgi:hypothetical protein
MPLNAPASRFAKSHLEAVIRELEREAGESRYNTMCIRAFAFAATLVGQQEYADRATQLLRAAPDEIFWAGIITNVELPIIVPEILRTVDAPEDLDEHYPPYREEDILQRIRFYAKTEAHIALCLEGRFQDPRSSPFSESSTRL